MSFDETVINLASPALCGIKPSNMFSMSTEAYNCGSHKLTEWNTVLKNQGIYILPIQKGSDRILFYVYNIKMVKDLCSNCKIQSYLYSKGYPVYNGVESILSELQFRLMSDESFPNEVGIFLGYPLEDVIQFEKNCGENYRFCGIWKVYSNPEKAISLMNKYKQCSEFCHSLWKKGITVPDTALLYKKQLRGQK